MITQIQTHQLATWKKGWYKGHTSVSAVDQLIKRNENRADKLCLDTGGHFGRLLCDIYAVYHARQVILILYSHCHNQGKGDMHIALKD